MKLRLDPTTVLQFQNEGVTVLRGLFVDGGGQFFVDCAVGTEFLCIVTLFTIPTLQK
ncbi:MAG: hypothetical protein ACI9PC_001780 [Porticoccaceae bacterium]|jgi:hypothetical protein